MHRNTLASLFQCILSMALWNPLRFPWLCGRHRCQMRELWWASCFEKNTGRHCYTACWYGHESHGTVFPCVKVMPTGAAGGTEVSENQMLAKPIHLIIIVWTDGNYFLLIYFTIYHDHNPIKMLHYNELSHGWDEILSVWMLNNNWRVWKKAHFRQSKTD